MQISLDDVIAFVRIAKLGSFKEAAEELCLTQSALSRRIKKLEDMLGARLLDRTTRSVSLTVIGNDFLPDAERMIGDFEKSVGDILDVIQMRAGLVKIATNMTSADTLMPEIVQRFNAVYPEIRIRMMESSSPKAIDRVLSGEAEFGICQNVLGHPEIAFEPMLEDEFTLVCHRDHPLAERDSIAWQELVDHSFVSMRPTSGTWKILEASLGEKAKLMQGSFEVEHFGALLALLGRNLAVSALPRLAVEKRPDLDLVSVPLRSPPVSRSIGVATVKEKSLSPAAAAMRDITRDVLTSTTLGRAASYLDRPLDRPRAAGADMG